MTVSIKTFFDPDTYSLTHLVYDLATKQAAVIDPVLNYDPVAVATSTSSAKEVLAVIQSKGLSLKWILETHVHADHMSAAFWLKQQTNASIVIGEGVTQVQQTFNLLYELNADDVATASDFDRLVKDGDELALGETKIKVIQTPGHTPSCCTYVIENNAFVGDTLFMPDFGTSRCDFPGGDAALLYQSIQKILALPDDTNLLMCHDYMPNGRELKWQTTVGEQKQSNIHIHHGVTEAEYIKMRTERDSELKVPKLILPALQVNIKAGRLPTANDNGGSFLKLPLNKL